MKTLRIITDVANCIGNIPDLIPPFTLEVESLELTTNSSHLDTLRSIIRPSSLTTLALTAVSEINLSSLYAFFDAHGTHLQSFKCVAQYAPEGIAVLGGSCLATCTQLRTISLSLGVYVVHGDIEALVSGWNACIELIINIPAELEHVTLIIPILYIMRFPKLGPDEGQEVSLSLPWTSIKNVVNKLPTLQQVEVVLATDILKAENITTIQKEVRKWLGEETMKKVTICVGK